MGTFAATLAAAAAALGLFWFEVAGGGWLQMQGQGDAVAGVLWWKLALPVGALAVLSGAAARVRRTGHPTAGKLLRWVTVLHAVVALLLVGALVLLRAVPG